MNKATRRRIHSINTFLILLLFTAGTGCHQSSGNAAEEAGHVVFDLEIRDSGTLDFRQTGDRLEGTLSVEQGYVLLPGGTPFSGTGRVERSPMTGVDLYTFHFPGPTLTEGPCFPEPVSYELTLIRRDANSRLTGSLAVYCSEENLGEPPMRIMKISGGFESPASGGGD